MNKEQLIIAGIDYDRGVERCMNNSSFYENMLSKYATDTDRIETIMCYHDGQDYTQFEMSVHDLKGVTGNLSIMPVYVCTTRLMKLLRSENMDYDAIEKVYKDFLREHELATEAIRNAMECNVI